MKLAVVVPCYNEEEALGPFAESLFRALADLVPASIDGADVVVVDDGSSDRTWEILRGLVPPAGVRLHGVGFSRNFGHQAAILAGLDFVRDRLKPSPQDTVVLMDGDGQHPPALIGRIVTARLEGWHHVQMVRQDDAGSGRAPWLRRNLSRAFYDAFARLTGLPLVRGGADFRGFSGAVLRAYGGIGEVARFNRGLFTWLGFRTAFIPYEPGVRLAGETRYTLRAMFGLGLGGIVDFSSKPLVMTSLLTTLIGLGLCLGYVALEAYRFLVLGIRFVPGWASTVFSVVFWGTLLSLNQLVMAVYIARVFDEVKRRPAYVIEKTIP